MPQNTVQAIVRTSDGYLWIGTQEGLVRFDGLRFTVYDKSNTKEIRNNTVQALTVTRDGSLWVGTGGGGLYRMKEYEFIAYDSRAGLSNDFVYALYEDREGNLWIGTDGGIDVFRDGKFTHYTSQQGLSNEFVRCILQDSKGRIWAGTFGGGLNLWAQGKFSAMTTRDGLPNDFVRAIMEDREGDLWIGTAGGGMSRWKENGITTFTTKEGLANDFVRAIVEDRDGNIWIGTDGGGLSRLHNGKFSNFSSSQGLVGNRVVSLYEDSERNFWIGTYDGLNRLRDGTIVAYSKAEGLSHDMARCVFQDHRGNIWIGTDEGLNLWKEGRFIQYTRKDGLSHDSVYSINEDRSGALWVGTYGGGLNRFENGKFTVYTTKDGLSNDDIRSIQPDVEGNLWIGTNGAGLNRFRDGIFVTLGTREGLLNDFVRPLLISHDGSLWIGSNGGLNRYKNGLFQSFTTREGLSNNAIRAIYEDKDETLWIGTYSGGLNRIRAGKVTAYTVKEGLFDDVISEILEDAKGNLWMSCNKGIFRMSKKDLNEFADGKISSISFVSYGKKDGMKSSECNGSSYPSGWKTSDGKLWFPTTKGVVVIDPENLSIREQPPAVRIEAAIADGEAINLHNLSELLPGKAQFEFQYTGINFSAPERVQFKYKLEGFDKDWVSAENRRTAFYTNIPPGKYTFRVTARNQDGAWSDAGAAVSFLLKPRFYQTYWFYSLCALGVLLAGAGAHRIRVKQLQAREKELVTLVENRTRDLVLEKDRTEKALLETEDARREAERQKEEAEKQKERAEKSAAIIEMQSQKLIETDRIKSRFFSNISHEFRTPLTLTIGPMENLLQGHHGPLSVEQIKQLELMLTNSRRLLRLINQLLDISKLEAGKMDLQARKGNIVRLVKQVALLFSSFAEKKNIQLQVNAPKEEMELYFDADKMEKILYNLLSNAFKFTARKGKVWVTVSETEAGTAEIRVKDTGIGIPPEHLPYVFERFRQSGHSQEQEGTGIGLSLVKDLIALHGGSIHVTSEIGFGTEFVTSFPLGTQHLGAGTVLEDAGDWHGSADRANMELAGLANAEPARGADLGNTPGANGRETILVVEDNPDVREYIQSILKDFCVIEAKDGEEGLNMARERMPSLVISDVMMPGMSGYELCQHLKQDELAKRIPIILLTAKASEEMKVEGLESGADDYMAKPFNARELQARVKNLIQLRRRQESVEELGVMRERLRPYVPSHLLQKLMNPQEPLQLSAERKTLTLVHSNLEGFAEICGRVEPDCAAEILNDYLTKMTSILEKHGGMTCRFHGDQLISLFGGDDTFDPSSEAANAVSAALAMQEQNRKLSDKWRAEGVAHNMALRIGIVRDDLILGSFGTSSYREYAPLGSAVGLARILGGAAIPGKIAVSFPVYSLTQGRFSYDAPEDRQIAGWPAPIRFAELSPG